MKAIFILLTILFCIPAFSQQATIKGRVSNLSVPNDTAFTLVFKQSGKIVGSTICHQAGYYSIDLKPGQYDMIISKVDCKDQRLDALSVYPGTNEINLSLAFPRITTGKLQNNVGYSSISSGDLTDMAGAKLRVSKTEVKRSAKSSSTSTSRSKHKSKRSRKHKRYGKKRHASSSAKKSGIRGATSTPAYAAGTTATRSGVVGRGSRTDGSSEYIEVAEVSKSSADRDPDPNRPGQVTAGHWRDLDHWKDWKRTNQSNAISAHMRTWGLYPKSLNCLQITDQNGALLPFAKVKLKNGTETLWESVTDINGKAYLWPMVTKDSAVLEAKDLEVLYNGASYPISDYTTYLNNTAIRLQTTKVTTQRIEIGFMVDATGSMGDEIRFLQRELIDVVSRIKKERLCMDIYTGSVFYKDHGDDYVTRVQPLTSNPVNTIDFISHQYASGGGDFPEAVDFGLEACIQELKWSDEAGTKILFILLDAPPHVDPEIQARLNKAILIAAAKGIRLVPVAASGINQQTEFLLKYMAIISNGEYLYITDDSNIGGRHLLPTGGKSDVEFLNDLMVKTIIKYSESNCPKTQDPIKTADSLQVRDSSIIREQVKQKQKNEIILGSNWHMRFFPNPASELVYFEFSEEVQSLRIYDMSGRLMFENSSLNGNQTQVDVSQFNSGLYSVQVQRKQEIVSGKLLVMH